MGIRSLVVGIYLEISAIRLIRNFYYMVIQQYQDPSINRMLKLGYWYEAHKALLYKILIGSLIGINALCWIWTFYGGIRIEAIIQKMSLKSVEISFSLLVHS